MSAMNHALIELQEAAGADSLHPPEKGRAVGPGFVAVPVEPTPEMLREATNSVRQFSADRAATVYSAMLRAARKAASKIAIDFTDGDHPCDSTIAHIAEQIDRLMPPGAPK